MIQFLNLGPKQKSCDFGDVHGLTAQNSVETCYSLPSPTEASTNIAASAEQFHTLPHAGRRMRPLNHQHLGHGMCGFPDIGVSNPFYPIL